jgi:hypothetical protein
MSNNNKVAREHLLYLLKGDGAHLEFDGAVKNMPAEFQGRKPNGAEHSPWELLEHLRIAQWDLLEYITNPKHVSPEFPAGYWPASSAPPDAKAWNKSVEQFKSDFAALEKLVSDDATDPLAELPHAEGQTIFRKVALAADHNSYHLGQLVLLRRVLGAWE